jgi:rubrerythrin
MTYTAPAAEPREFRCAACGYGISVSGALPTCPMCQAATTWNRTSEKRTVRSVEALPSLQ